jgi:hypothetical protein
MPSRKPQNRPLLMQLVASFIEGSLGLADGVSHLICTPLYVPCSQVAILRATAPTA